jgi:hypothetical protein
MATYSQSLKLTLLANGEGAGTWGQTTNTNLGTLLEQAITGVQSIVMSDADYTLSNLNGASDEARNPVLVVTGTNNAVRDIIAPLEGKLYVIRNSTTGGFAVNIRASSGNSVAIPNGATVWVYCDGTNFNAIGTESIGNFDVNGNLTVSGTTTLTGALGGSTATFSGAISSVSPAFTGTPTAPNANVATVSTQIATTAFVRDIIPAGVILLWSGSLANIPLGWVLCNGSSGTPDLRDRFIVGAGNGYAVGATGGQTDATLVSHTHTISDPGHVHSMGPTVARPVTGTSALYSSIDGVPGVINTQSAVTGITINSTGSPATNANLPPYYALAYIMKT